MNVQNESVTKGTKCSHCAAVITTGKTCQICHKDSTEPEGFAEYDVKPRPSAFVVVIMCLFILVNSFSAISSGLTLSALFAIYGFVLPPVMLAEFALSVFVVIVCINVLRMKNWAVKAYFILLVLIAINNSITLVTSDVEVTQYLVSIFLSISFFFIMITRDWTDYY